MKIQMLVAGAFALIQSVVSGHEVPSASFRGQVTKLQAESQVEVLADETEEEERRRRWRSRRGSRRWRGRGRRFRRRRGGSFGRCMRRCGGGSRCKRRCNFTEQDILDLFEFTGGFSVMPDDEDFEAYDYGAENIQDAMDMVMESDEFDPDTIFASLMGAYEDDTCLTEIGTIYEDEAYMATLDAMYEMCPATHDETETTWTLTSDYSGECGLGVVESACAAASGVHLTFSMTINCKGKDHPEYTSSFSTTSAPFCAGASCKEPTSEEQGEAQAYWTGVLEGAIEEEFSKAGIDAEGQVECEVSFS